MVCEGMRNHKSGRLLKFDAESIVAVWTLYFPLFKEGLREIFGRHFANATQNPPHPCRARIPLHRNSVQQARPTGRETPASPSFKKDEVLRHGHFLNCHIEFQQIPSTGAVFRPNMPGTPRQMAFYVLLCWAVIVAGCTQPAQRNTLDIRNTPPPAPREFRAVWVASVANIDWPSRKDLTVAEQRAEISSIIERASELKLNAIILQVRTSADALYDSTLEPWSEYLTGEQGKAPQPFYDPLNEWIEKAHARGIELHAWFNPYRARHTAAKSPPSRDHIANTHPGAVKSYGGYLWMDPGEPIAAKRTLDVILDVVRRYDIDGVHIDDYFYPYPVTTPAVPPATPIEIDFPDAAAWSNYLLTGGKLARADWRRQNVNTLIEKIYTGIKAEKRWVKFGVSPFGLGKPELRPPGIAGFSQYDKLYADVELWLQRGWMDYFVPQLYWPINQPPQAFGVLLDYWLKQNIAHRHVWPGLYTSRIMTSANPNPGAPGAPGEHARSWEPSEILNQIALTRARAIVEPLANGHVHFSMAALSQNRKSISDQLKRVAYPTTALVPSMPWLGAPPTVPIITPNVNAISRKMSLQISAGAGALPLRYAIWTRDDKSNGWKFQAKLVGTQDRAKGSLDWALDSTAASSEMVISAIDRIGNESARVTLNVSPEGVRILP